MKKLFTLFALLVAIVTGAQADTEVFSMETKWKSQSVTQNGITVTFSDVIGNAQTGYYKFTKGNTMTISSTVGNITALSFTSHNEKYGKANGTTVNTGTLTGAGTANISWSGDASEVIFTNDASKGGDWRVASITVTYSSGPATQPVITTQPQNVTYSIGSTDYPSFSIVATASAGELKYQWQYSFDGNSFTAIPDAMVSSAATATLSGAEAFPVLQALMGGSIPEGKYYFNCVLTDDNASVTSNTATLTVVDPSKTVIAPTFDKADGSTIKAGEAVIVTSSEGSQIYYNWSSKASGAYTADQLLTRTPKDSPASVTTSTTGTRYLYALAKSGESVSDISIIGLTVNPDPVKGQLDKVADNVQTGEAVTAPVFTVVDADGNPSPASLCYGTETNKDVTVKFEIASGSTEGIITLMADGSGVEAINTDAPGTATVNITLSSNKNGYPIIDGEGSYSYTVTVTGEQTKPAITGQPQDATYVIGTEDYPSMSVTATASAGELKYQWHIIVPSVGDIAIPGAEASTLSLATYATQMAAYLSQEGSYSIYCNVADDNGNVDSNTATLTVSEAAPGPELDEQTDVTGDMTWDWSAFSTVSSATVELTETTTPKKDEEFVLSNVVNYGLLDNVSDEFQAIKAFCQYPVRDGKYFQGSEIRFYTTVPGKVKATFASTGSSKDTHNRDILINGEVAGNANKTTTFTESSEIEVAAGEVTVMGVLHGEGAQGTPQYLRISKIVFTTGTPTGVNGVAEAETEAPANVKIIKNGQLFIGKFNIAGQQVK